MRTQDRAHAQRRGVGYLVGFLYQDTKQVPVVAVKKGLLSIMKRKVCGWCDVCCILLCVHCALFMLLLPLEIETSPTPKTLDILPNIHNMMI